MSLTWQDPESRDKRKPLAECPLFDQARARKGDPETSKQAARSVMNLGPTRDAILRILRSQGPLTDEGIEFWAAHLPDFQYSPSGLRSRRADLVRMGLVTACGIGTTAAGRNCTIWRIR